MGSNAQCCRACSYVFIVALTIVVASSFTKRETRRTLAGDQVTTNSSELLILRWMRATGKSSYTMSRSSFGKSRKRNVERAGALIPNGGEKRKLRLQMADGRDGEAMYACAVVVYEVRTGATRTDQN